KKRTSYECSASHALQGVVCRRGWSSGLQGQPLPATPGLQNRRLQVRVLPPLSRFLPAHRQVPPPGPERPAGQASAFATAPGEEPIGHPGVLKKEEQCSNVGCLKRIICDSSGMAM